MSTPSASSFSSSASSPQKGRPPSAPYPPLKGFGKKSSLSSRPQFSGSLASSSSAGTAAPTLGNANNNNNNNNNTAQAWEGGLRSTSVGSSATDPGPVRGSSVTQATSSSRLPSLASSSPSWPCTARFVHPSLVAVTNYHSSSSTKYQPERNNTPASASRKRGPVLLSLQRLTWVASRRSRAAAVAADAHTHSTDDEDDDDDDKRHPTTPPSSLYDTTQTVAQSRGNPALGTSVASTSLDVAPVLDSSHATTLPLCATGLTTGALGIHAFALMEAPENDNDDDHDSDDSFRVTSTATEYFHTGRHHRPATAVAWRPHHPSQVAITWGTTAGGGGASPAAATASSPTTPTPGPTSGSATGSLPNHGGGMNLAGRSSQPHDRDFGCFVWDIARGSSNTATPITNKVPLRRLGHQVGAASVGWIMKGDLLVLGTQGRHVQLFDLRAEQPASHPVTVYAHPSHVQVRPDPHRPHQFATFSHNVTEPVKLWDARRVDSPVSEIKWSSASTAHTNDAVSDVQWSPVTEGCLTVAVGDALYDYDTTSSRPVQVGLVSTPQPVTSFCLYPYRRPGETSTTAETERLSSPPRIQELYQHRAIVCYGDRTIQDVAKHRLAPVDISRRDGRLAQALGSTLRIGSTVDGPAAMECLQIRPEEDVSATMMRRARCLHVARYSMDTTSNIKLLAEDGNVLSDSGEVSPTRESLLRLWVWVDRMESLFSEDDGTWPALSLVEAGASSLLRKIRGEDTVEFSETLSCSVYSSPSRRAALTSCGWAGRFDLSNVLSECEGLGEYERSAALAVWHGDVGAGVEALQRGAAFLRSSKNSYAETLELVALCVAGFRGGSDPSLGIWRQACSNLMDRSELSGVNRSQSRVAYLRGLLRFLMDTDGGHQQVLDDDNLSLCDRVGFACRFLAKEPLQAFLDSCVEKCQQQANVEGLTISGLDRTGIKILQAYVDRYADVQTAALVTSRVILPTEWEEEKWICVEWLDSYRSLLNTWQMWQSRAMFDVDRSELMRTLQAREATQTKSPSSRLPASNRRFLMAVPFQMEARCTYCQQSLSLKQNNTNTNQWLREMNKSVLSCCPHCRSPLPRCAICMLSLGALNPFVELQARAGRTPGRQSPEEMATASNLPFAEWFSWCMRCKHGGHAHHMVGWFANHDVCPVSGCDCRCQFDGISLLNRPALSKSNVEC